MFNKRGTVALMQILILVVGIFAFSFLLSDFVSAANAKKSENKAGGTSSAINPTNFPEGTIKYGGVTYTQIVSERELTPWGSEYRFYGLDKSGKKIDITEKLTADGWANKNTGEIYESKNYFNMFDVQAAGFASAALNGLKWAG